MSTLENCPLCDKKVIMYNPEKYRMIKLNRDSTLIHCTNCDLKLENRSKHKAIELWNNRMYIDTRIHI